MVSDGTKVWLSWFWSKAQNFCIHANRISWFKGDIWLWFFTLFQFFYHQIRKKNILKSCSFGVGRNFLYIFLLFSHKISKVLKLSAINKYHLTWGIYTSHSFLKIENFIVSKLLKKVLLSDSVILAMWSVKYHFTEVMTTNLETIFDFSFRQFM